jgi:hypothetical protein
VAGGAEAELAGGAREGEAEAPRAQCTPDAPMVPHLSNILRASI